MQPPSQDPSNPTGQPSMPPPPPMSFTQGSYPPGEEDHYNRISQVGGPVTQSRPGSQGKLDVPSKPRNGWKAATLVLFILVLILATATTTLVLTRPTSTAPVAVRSTVTATQAVQQPTSASTDVSPTSVSTPSSTAAAQPSATVASGTITENITLTCGGCNDPVRVRINTVQIDTANGRMIWNITLTNITGSNVGYGMDQFNLQADASQTQIPATFSQRNGNLVSNTPSDIQAIFAFVPSHNVAYTLAAIVGTNIAGQITFDPVKITF